MLFPSCVESRKDGREVLNGFREKIIPAGREREEGGSDLKLRLKSQLPLSPFPPRKLRSPTCSRNCQPKKLTHFFVGPNLYWPWPKIQSLVNTDYCINNVSQPSLALPPDCLIIVRKWGRVPAEGAWRQIQFPEEQQQEDGDHLEQHSWLITCQGGKWPEAVRSQRGPELDWYDRTSHHSSCS